MKPIERVKKVIEFKGLSISGFEKATGMSNNSIQTAIKRNSNLKDDTLNSILICFPDISAEWLLTGNGSMLKEEKINSFVNEPVANYGDISSIKILKEEVKLQKEKIEFYLEQIDYFKNQLAIKKAPNKKRIEDALDKLDKMEEAEIKKIS